MLYLRFYTELTTVKAMVSFEICSLWSIGDYVQFSFSNFINSPHYTQRIFLHIILKGYRISFKDINQRIILNIVFKIYSKLNFHKQVNKDLHVYSFVP